MNKIKVLIADDSPTQLSVMTQPFLNNYDVITAKDGQEALEKASSERPALAVLDVIMPKYNGFQVCRKIKKNAALKAIKVILLTSKSQESDKYWGMKQGADAYMTKPFDTQELLSVAGKLLGERY
jgi:twitching motility two-component system response regulator PilH